MKNQLTLKLRNATKSRGVAFAFLIVIGVFQALMTVLFALAVKNLINEAEFNGGETNVIISAVFLLICVLLIFIGSVLYNLLLAKCQTRVETNVKSYVFSSFINGEFRKVKMVNSGDLISRLSGDVNTVASVYTGLLPSLIATICKLVAIIVALLLLQPTFTLFIALAGLVVFLLTYCIRKTTSKLYKKTRVKDGEVNNYFNEVAHNALVVKAFNTEDYVKSKADKELSSLKKNKLNQRYFSACVSSLTGFMFTLFYAVTVVFGVSAIINGANGVNFGVVIAMLQLILQIRAPIGSISGYITSYAEMNASLERLFEIIPSDDEILNKTEVNKNEFTKIEFDGVSFAYENERIIKKSSFTINKGDRVLIKGTSGIGKSTILNLIIGLYSPNEGSVLIGDKLSCEVKGVFSLVPQGNMLFSGSIRNNLLFANENATESEIERALKVTHLNKFISELPNGLDTIIGENAFNLSEGQAQRIAIARALLSNKPVIILDEPTSALDDDTEKLVLEELSKIQGLTIIAVSHKKAIYEICNKVFTIKNCKVVEE